MKVISHRANLFGPNTQRENNPVFIEECLNFGFDVEIDVWFIKNNFYLGHDHPIYKVNKQFLINDKLWCHAKNFKAVENMFLEKHIHYFWHQKDNLTLTSKNIPWCYPNFYIKNGVTVECGKPKKLKYKIMGICTDYPVEWNNL